MSFLTHLFLWVRINSHSRLITHLIQDINPDQRADLKPDNLIRLWEAVLICSAVCADETMVINVFCGVVSGVMSSCLANPTDVLKVSLTTSRWL